MINLLTNKKRTNTQQASTSIFQKCKGAATLFSTIILLTLSGLIIVFAANYSNLYDKSTSNITRKAQSFNAAQAGIDFGINYLKVNNATILANPVSGFIPAFSDSNTTNVTLANNSSYSITYTNPIASNYDLILITSTGLSDDSTASTVITQLVQSEGYILADPPNVPLATRGNALLRGSSEVVNIYSNNTITAGGSVTFQGSGHTTLSTGEASNSSTTGADVTQNDSTISSLSEDQFFETYFASNPNSLKNSAGIKYENSSSYNYSGDLNGVTDEFIWIDQTSGNARFTSNATIGSPTAPVLLVVNGDARFAGTIVIYGYVFILGDTETDITGNVTIYGSVSASGDLDAAGSMQVNYNPTVLNNLQENLGSAGYSRVLGSWKDY